MLQHVYSKSPLSLPLPVCKLLQNRSTTLHVHSLRYSVGRVSRVTTVIPHKSVLNTRARTPMPVGVLADSSDVTLAIFGAIQDTYYLYSAARTCKAWKAVLRDHPEIWRTTYFHVPRKDATGRICLTVEHSLRHAPAGERIKIVDGTCLRGQLYVPVHLHVKAEGKVRLEGTLQLDGTAHPPRGKLVDCSSARGECGVIEGLQITHFMEEACVVQGGSWRLDSCTVSSSRASGRASTALRVRNGAALALRGCGIMDATNAVCLERWPCQVHGVESVFTGTTAAIFTRGGGTVDLRQCRFEDTEVALKLDVAVRGIVMGCTFDEGITSIFGPWERPRAFRCVDNALANGAALADEGEVDDAGCANVGQTGLAGARGGGASSSTATWPQLPAGHALPTVASPSTVWVQCDSCNKWRVSSRLHDPA